MTKIFDFLDSLDPNLGAVYSANNLVLMTDKEYSNRLEQIRTLTTENRRLQQKVNQLESTLNEVREWKEEFGDACTFSIVSNPSLGNWYFALEDILEEGGSNE